MAVTAMPRVKYGTIPRNVNSSLVPVMICARNASKGYEHAVKAAAAPQQPWFRDDFVSIAQKLIH